MTLAHQASISGMIYPQDTTHQPHRRFSSALSNAVSCQAAGPGLYRYARLASDATIGGSARASGLQQGNGAAGRYSAMKRRLSGAVFLCSSSAAAFSEVRDGPFGCTPCHCMYSQNSTVQMRSLCSQVASGGLRYDHVLIALMDDNPYLSDGSKQVQEVRLDLHVSRLSQPLMAFLR